VNVSVVLLVQLLARRVCMVAAVCGDVMGQEFDRAASQKLKRGSILAHSTSPSSGCTSLRSWTCWDREAVLVRGIHHVRN
jgi:hypothetical protein